MNDTGRCDYCDRRTDRPADPYCRHIDRHSGLPDLAQRIVDAIESDMSGRSGMSLGQFDRETQDEIRDSWAAIIREELAKATGAIPQ